MIQVEACNLHILHQWGDSLIVIVVTVLILSFEVIRGHAVKGESFRTHCCPHCETKLVGPSTYQNKY